MLLLPYLAFLVEVKMGFSIVTIAALFRSPVMTLERKSESV